jgi:hypothetical protein
VPERDPGEWLDDAFCWLFVLLFVVVMPAAFFWWLLVRNP